MRNILPRILYIIAVLSCARLLWANPVTIFLAGALSCVTIPIYRRLRFKAMLWRRHIDKGVKSSRWTRFLLRLTHIMPVTIYTLFIVFSLVLPVAALVSLVSPQAMAGYTRLMELRASNFQLPPHWQEYIRSLKNILAEYPRIEKAVNEAIANLDSLFSDAVGMLVSRSFGFVGSTMNAFWLAFLFLTLTILFTLHAGIIRKISYRIPQIPPSLLARFIRAIRRALKAIILGIVFVALVQGALCGIGFAFAGVNQPAFWGLLATMVAPIPVVGTALVWAPLCISLWFSGKTVAAVGLALWGSLFVAGVDNVLRPFFLRQGIKAPFFVLILSILCGLSAFNAVGLIAGPVLLAIAMQAYEEANRYYRRPF